MAQYKYNTLATEVVEWVGKSGKALKVVVSLVEETMDYFGTGEYKPTRDSLRINTDSFIDSKSDVCGCWVQELGKHAQGDVVAKIGNIGLTAERAAEIKAASARVAAHPAWVEKMAQRDAGNKAEREYQAHVKAVENMMTLNGKSK